MTYPAFRTSLLEFMYYKVLRSEVPNGLKVGERSENVSSLKSAVRDYTAISRESNEETPS